jgi:hypothetical protein
MSQGEQQQKFTEDVSRAVKRMQAWWEEVRQFEELSRQQPGQTAWATLARSIEERERLRRELERIAYERGIRQAEKFGHSGMAEDLRLVLDGLGN